MLVPIAPGIFEVYNGSKFVGTLRRFSVRGQPYAGLPWYYSGPGGSWYESLEEAKTALGLA